MSNNNSNVAVSEAAVSELKSCDDIIINAPNKTQPSGWLLSVCLKKKTIIQVSGNIASLLDITVEDCLGTHVTHFFPRPLVSKLMHSARQRRHIKHLLQTFPFSRLDSGGREKHVECLAHFSDGCLVIEALPGRTDRLDTHTINEQMLHNFSQLSGSRDIEAVSQIAAKNIQDITGYDRVMVYRFDKEWSGEVIAEATSKHSEGRFLGLYFPSSDLPRQARALYHNHPLRMLADVDAEEVEIVPLVNENTQRALDMTDAILRGVAPSHIEYLRNMGITASLSAAIFNDNRLWGLIVCHHESGPKITNFALQRHILSTANLVANQVKLIRSIDFNQKSNELRIITDSISKQIHDGESLFNALRNETTALKRLFSASNIYLHIGGKHYLAETTAPNQLELNAFRSAAKDGILISHAAKTLNNIPKSSQYCGVAFIGIDSLLNEFMLLERDEIIKTVSWGGRPDQFNGRTPQQLLRPRKSFAAWCEQVAGKSREFNDEEYELLRMLRHCMIENHSIEQKRISDALLVRQANTDSLTGLPNRNCFNHELKKCFLSNSQNAVNFALAFIDLDNFKNINDTAGHQIGDQILIRVAQRFSGIFYKDDFFARLSGDEFTAIVRHDVSRANLAELAQALLDALAEPFDVEGGRFYLSASIGFALPYHDGDDPNSLMKCADLAMYDAKHQGRNRFTFFSKQLTDEVEHRVAIHSEIRRALKEDQFCHYFQPIIDTETQRMVGAEAVMRWLKDTGDVVEACHFTNLAEEFFLISKMDLKCLASTLHFLEELKPDQEYRFSINLNGNSLKNDSVNKMLDMIEESELSGAQFNFEIVESILIQNKDNVAQQLNRALAMGANIYIDDFGTGYSSLSYLDDFQFSAIKIDKSFIRSIDNPKTFALISGIAAMACNLNAMVIAEGVETQRQALTLIEMGITLHQGYYYARPMPSADFAAYINKHS